MELRSCADVCLVLILLLRYCTGQLLFAVNGQWGSWGWWETCSKKCGWGSQSRRRLCDSPAPAYGGADCHGVATETQDCYLLRCLADSEDAVLHSAIPAVFTAAAIGGAVLVAAVAAISFYVRRRGRMTSGTDATAASSSAATPSATAATARASVYQIVEDPSHDADTTNYERLDVSTLGQTSVYTKVKKSKK